jgi:uncharacterized membrane protein
MTHPRAASRPEAHPNLRLEALCDAVFAIAMTLLILDIRLTSTENIATTSALWRAIQQLTPAIVAFVVSFGIILITWVNHWSALKLVNGSSVSFLYANGFLLLTVVALPFPTGLVGEFLWTDHAAPAVVLYNAVLAAQAIGWILLGGTALSNRLTPDAKAAARLRQNTRHGYEAFGLYSLLAVMAVWFPLASGIVTAATWMFWLALSIRMDPKA